MVLSLLHAGPGAASSGGGGGLGTPFLVAGDINMAAGTHPVSTTTANCPAGSVIMALVFNVGTGGAALTGYSDGTNTYTGSPTIINLYNSNTQFTMYATGPIGAQLNSGASVGPNMDASTSAFQIVVCFPGATSLDPEAASSDAYAVGAGSTTSTVPSNSTQPQYAAFGAFITSQGDATGFTSSGNTDVGGQIGQDSGFGLRFWVKQITTTGSSTALTATVTSGGGGVGLASLQRTVK